MCKIYIIKILGNYKFIGIRHNKFYSVKFKCDEAIWNSIKAYNNDNKPKEDNEKKLLILLILELNNYFWCHIFNIVLFSSKSVI